jgi:hypothetical protein
MRQAYQIALIIVKFQSEYNPSIDNALEGPRRRTVQAVFFRRRHQPRSRPLGLGVNVTASVSLPAKTGAQAKALSCTTKRWLQGADLACGPGSELARACAIGIDLGKFAF